MTGDREKSSMAGFGLVAKALSEMTAGNLIAKLYKRSSQFYKDLVLHPRGGQRMPFAVKKRTYSPY